MNTRDVMGLALRMAGMKSVPPDSGVWVEGSGIRKVMFAIDAGPSELLLAKELGYDLVVAHHPVGPAKLGFARVIQRHVQFMTEKGVPRKTAVKAASELAERVSVRSHPVNYMHEVDFARELGMPFMNIHLPIDQVTRNSLLSSIDKMEPRTAGQLVDGLGRIREFREAETRIELQMGERSDPVGKWVLVFAAGTNGGYPVAKAYFDHGVRTVIYLHVDYDELSKIRRDCRGNLVVLGHMAGDSIGINMFLDELEELGAEVGTLGVIGRPGHGAQQRRKGA